MDTCIFLVFSLFYTKIKTNLSMLEFISSQSKRNFGPPNVFRVRCLRHKVSFSMYASSTLFEKPVVCCLLGSSSKIIFVSALDKEMWVVKANERRKLILKEFSRHIVSNLLRTELCVGWWVIVQVVECQLLLPQAPGIFWEGFFSFAKKESSNNPNVCISTLFFYKYQKRCT